MAPLLIQEPSVLADTNRTAFVFAMDYDATSWRADICFMPLIMITFICAII